jgi:hypothetical protein
VQIFDSWIKKKMAKENETELPDQGIGESDDENQPSVNMLTLATPTRQAFLPGSGVKANNGRSFLDWALSREYPTGTGTASSSMEPTVCLPDGNNLLADHSEHG